ncbi:MAG: tRNA (adenosine(37)-N6)-dimethylallyltransferase MiaA [Candidatus Staskawiczbacteria bacterium]|nr:tRNA (adenosine(37)-N6)-dimethylallyltransferase MiaA [Candidatus Staskawiczbacteria bacterium]
MEAKNKLIVVLGPTASGKTDLSIKLAKKFDGEIISADSRQVYRGMNIGSGKVTKKEMLGIPHYLLDVADPKKKFTVSQYQKLALSAIKKIYDKGKVPLLVGGSGFYIQSIVDGIIIPEVKPDWKLRKKLEEKNNEELYETLLEKDPARAKNIDKNNPRRLIRALEIILKTKKSVPNLETKSQFNVLEIGIAKNPDELKELINKRLLKRLKGGMVTEVKKLKASGLSFNRLKELGLEYRFVAQWIFCNMRSADIAKYRRVFRCPFSYQEMISKLQKEIEHFAKN